MASSSLTTTMGRTTWCSANFSSAHGSESRTEVSTTYVRTAPGVPEAVEVAADGAAEGAFEVVTVALVMPPRLGSTRVDHMVVR